MAHRNFCILLIALLSLATLAFAEKEEVQEAKRDGKVFSLFSVVQFKNVACISTSSLSTGQSTNRNGTCFSSSECSRKGGSAKGSCASGFGVCCVFTVSAASSTINVNDTYIQNPGFPSAYSGTNAVSYTIQKCSNDICWIRLDFEQFNNLGPSNTVETTGGTCTDSFTVTTSSSQQVPVICGVNNGQHIYLDLGALPTDTATLNFNFAGTSTSRIWDIKASQIPCGTNYAPPNGCLQYQYGLTGRIKSFNFDATSSTHLASQSYAHCIRREEGYCCVLYQVCSDANSFKLNNDAATALVDSECTKDYINIETSSSACQQVSAGVSFTNKYCGNILNTFKTATVNSPICDCTAPFEVNIRTDNLADTNSATVNNRGVCLDYTQVPCTN